MLVKELQVTAAGGIHLTVAVRLQQIAFEEDAFISIKANKKSASARDFLKILSLRIRQFDRIQIIVDSKDNDSAVLERIEQLLCSGGKDI